MHDTGLFNLTLPYTDDFVPHMTITEGRSSGRAIDESMPAEVQSQAPQGGFMLSEIVYTAPDEHFYFEIKKRLKLSGH